MSHLPSIKHCVISITVILMLAWTTSCSNKIKGLSEEAFRINQFDDASLATEGLALMPVIVLDQVEKTPNASGGEKAKAPYAPEYREASVGENISKLRQNVYQVILNGILLAKIQSRRPALKLIPPGDVLIRLNDSKTPCSYSHFTQRYIKNGFSKEQLAAFGSALNCRYLFLNQAAVTENQSDISFSFIWKFGRKSLLQSVKINGQIWDTESGRQVWEGIGVGYIRLSGYQGPPLIEKLAVEAVDNLLAKMIP